MKTPVVARPWFVREPDRDSTVREDVQQVRFHLYTDGLHDGYVSYRGLTIGYLQDWGAEGCLFIPSMTICENEHPRPQDADTMPELYEQVCVEIKLARPTLDGLADDFYRKYG